MLDESKIKVSNASVDKVLKKKKLLTNRDNT